jgi:hypothetical protein
MEILVTMQLPCSSESFILLSALYKRKDKNVKTILLPVGLYIKGRTQIEDDREQSAEENIWT